MTRGMLEPRRLAEILSTKVNINLVTFVYPVRKSYERQSSPYLGEIIDKQFLKVVG